MTKATVKRDSLSPFADEILTEPEMVNWEELIRDMGSDSRGRAHEMLIAAFAEIRRSRAFQIFARAEIDLLKDRNETLCQRVGQLIVQREEADRSAQRKRECEEDQLRLLEARKELVLREVEPIIRLRRGLTTWADPEGIVADRVIGLVGDLTIDQRIDLLRTMVDLTDPNDKIGAALNKLENDADQP